VEAVWQNWPNLLKLRDNCYSATPVQPNTRPALPTLLTLLCQLPRSRLNIRKVSVVAEGKAALLRNIEQIDRFYEELTTVVEKTILNLCKYMKDLKRKVYAERAELIGVIEGAIEEAEDCVIKGSTPLNPITKALWTLKPEELCFLTYNVLHLISPIFPKAGLLIKIAFKVSAQNSALSI